MITLSSKGFSLIEVLVSVFVLMLGVMTSMSLHLTALHSTQQSSMQTKAMHLAVELAESMRANLITISEQATTAQNNEDCERVTTPCVEQTLSSDEMSHWLQRVSLELPEGQARICQDAAPWDAGSGQLNWDCAAAESTTQGAWVIKIGWHDKMNKHASAHATPKLALTVQPSQP